MSREVRGAEAVARDALASSPLDLYVSPALINGAAGAVTTRDGKPFSVAGLTVRGRKITKIDILADPKRPRQLDLTILDRRPPSCAPRLRGHIRGASMAIQVPDKSVVQRQGARSDRFRHRAD